MKAPSYPPPPPPVPVVAATTAGATAGATAGPTTATRLYTMLAEMMPSSTLFGVTGFSFGGATPTNLGLLATSRSTEECRAKLASYHASLKTAALRCQKAAQESESKWDAVVEVRRPIHVTTSL